MGLISFIQFFHYLALSGQFILYKVILPERASDEEYPSITKPIGASEVDGFLLCSVMA